MGSVTRLLDRETYGLSQVDRLLGLRRGTAARWIDGYERRCVRYQPLVRMNTTGSQIVTWGEFVEVRLISEYRRQGVSVFRMRPAIMKLREVFETDYPLASAQPFTGVEGRELVLHAQQEAGLRPSLHLVVRSGQTIMPSLEVSRFQQVAEYGEGAVIRFRPAKHVVLDPHFASGEPTIAGRRLRVADIAEAVALGESHRSIAETWDLTQGQIEDAIRCSLIA